MHVRELRKNQTEPEANLWEILRNRRLIGVKFLRQHPFIYSYYRRPMYFIADFYCAEKSLVIELDGKVHVNQKEYDEQRDFILKQKGLKVLRIRNEELRDIYKVKKKILDAMA
jgi:very-short-patch-repair endonuclease